MPEDTHTPLPPLQSSATALQVMQSAGLSAAVLAPAGEPTGDEAVHFRDLLHVILKRKWAVIAFFLLAVVTTAVATSMVTPIFRSVISLKIDREQMQVVNFKDVTPTEQGWDQDFTRTQIELLKSRTLAERVVEQLNLRQDRGLRKAERNGWWSEAFRPGAEPEVSASPVATAPRGNEVAAGSFMGSMTVEPVRGSRLVRVYFDSPDPKLAADALNALAQNFINVNLERRYDASSYAKAFLEEKLAQTKARLEDAERALVAFQREQQIVTIGDTQNVLAQTLGDFNIAASRAEQERVKAEEQYREFVANPEGSPQVLGSPSLMALKQARAKSQVEYQNLLLTFKPTYPKMQQLQSDIDELDRQIKAETEILRRSIESVYKVAKAQEATILSRLEASKKNVLDLQGRSIQYNILKRDVETNRQFYEGLLLRMREVSVAGGIGVNNVTIVDPAQVPGRPYKPDLRRNLLIAVILGLIGGIGIAFFLEYLDDRLHRPEDMERITGLPVLGVVPRVKLAKGEEKVVLAMRAHQDLRSDFAEAYRSVRTALQFATREGAPRQFVVTSTTKGEGKSTTSLSLAINFAQAGQPVLLIDADLRNAHLHKYLGVDNSRGLSNFLSGDFPALAAVHTTSIPNLFVIPGGTLPPNPVELLSGPKLPTLLAQLSDRFTQIIIDAPPVLGLADALVLGNQIGSVVFVVAAGSTRKAHCRNALKRLRQAGVNPIGAVMTKLNLRDSMYGYESAYYYYRSTVDVPELPAA